MQFTLVAAAALVATTAASGLAKRDLSVSNTYSYNETCDPSKAHTKIVNRCSYPVYLWSIGKQYGCPSGSGLKLNTGEFYNENFQDPDPKENKDDGGVSVKISKFETCGGKDITQLEYKISHKEGFGGNYLDVSFVDCTRNLEDCPGRTDGFYLKAGNHNGEFLAENNNKICPIFNVNNAEEAAEVSYILPNDEQTKFCGQGANLEFYLCGGQAPDADDDAPVAVTSATPSSSQPQTSPSSKETPSSAAPASSSTTEEAYIVAAAAITKAPEPPKAPAPVVKTEVVYVTEYVNKRHAHGRRHQHFHA